MKRHLRLSRAAYRDLVAVGRYTTERWGSIQARRYLEQLNARLAAIATTPESGQRCDDIRLGYWRWFEGKHVIFYRMGPKGAVEVIRILHQSMMPEFHL